MALDTSKRSRVVSFFIAHHFFLSSASVSGASLRAANLPSTPYVSSSTLDVVELEHIRRSRLGLSGLALTLQQLRPRVNAKIAV